MNHILSLKSLKLRWLCAVRSSGLKLKLLARSDVLALLFTLVNPHVGVSMSAFRSAPARSPPPLYNTGNTTQNQGQIVEPFKEPLSYYLNNHNLFVSSPQQSQDNPPEEAVQ